MPRNHTAGPSTLRNRNRVTNKTRLRIITECIDADPIVLDEDEEKARVVSTAGVDAEDANEHHLQAVLSAAATRHQAIRATRTTEKETVQAAAYIPTPDSTGLVANYAELYPPGRWKDPSTYVKSSDTVEESISYALADGFIYYMDERDKEWLDKNNEEARGEGTSAQGAVSGTSTRSGRSTKGKGKDPDVAQPVNMSEDEFELVTAIFEKVTHEKTEFLHHGLEQGAPFPPFSDYQDTFANKLPPSMFAVFVVPEWVPEPETLLRMARVVYPYWRDRRLERGGHRIIPTVNLDETDTKNESYICFRRREIKAIRKTRAQQAPYADKMRRLQVELGISLSLAESVRDRERLKREQTVQGQVVWDKRLILVDLKRKFPILGTKEDEELFFDKEKVPKKPKTEATGRIPLKLRTRDNADTASPITLVEPQIKPKERQAMIQSQIEQELARRKEKDQRWEDLVDNPYQPLPTPYPSRLFRVIPPSKASASPWLEEESDSDEREYRAVRMRLGRGGRLHIDRRSVRRRTGRTSVKSDTHPWLAKDDSTGPDAREQTRILEERWRYDDDDSPPTGPDGPDEKDRTLIDDYDPKYLVRQASLLSEQDYQSLMTDPTLIVTGDHGQKQAIVPFRLGLPPPPPMPRRDVPISQRPGPSPTTPGMTGARSLSSSVRLSPVANGTHGTPVAMQTQIRNMPPPSSLPHMRISSNGGMRPPITPQVPAMLANISTPLITPSPHSTPPNSAGHVNGFPDVTTHAPDGNEPDTKQGVHASPNGTAQSNSDQPQVDAVASVTPSTSPLRPKTQVPQAVSIPAVSTNGYHLNPYAPTMPNGAYAMHPNLRHNGLSAQHVQSLKAAYASMSPSPDPTQANGNTANVAIRPPAPYLPHVMANGANYQMQQLAAQRLPWMVAAQQQQRSPSVHAVDANGVGIDGLGSPSLSPALAGVVPPRTPSANGMRNGALPRAVPVANAGQFAQGLASSANAHIARLAPPSPSPHMLSPSLAASQVQSSPTRAPQPPLASPSPSLQPRQVVGSSGAGY
ncbi:hypothetical protein OBBRIDRAFT_328810 [Obba rivulosa]|uniref:Enhancer of polycomb-like protein n=1 Tax=Obba rivulosa TaxID=1052685 RepID=A0A8E2DPG8_9APHY|nr:hypothetical protein OBBRIDRAFT_328810 [Obba rivulosa]